MELFLYIIIAAVVTSVIAVIFGGINAITDSIVNNYGEVDVDVNHGEKVFHVKGGGSLLSVMGEQKVFIPSACGGKGTCGACKAQILTEDPYGVLPTEQSWLTPDEVKEHYRLACQYKVKKNTEILLPPDLFLIKRYKCKVEVIEDLTYDTKKVGLRIVDGQTIEYPAGHYAQIVVPKFKWKDIVNAIGAEKANEYKKQTISFNKAVGNDVKEGIPGSLLKGEVNNTEEVQRAYSMSSNPSDNTYIEFVVRYVPGGLATSFVHFLLKQGQHLEVVGPFGDFEIHDAPDTEGMIWVAGGSGLAPFLGMVSNYLIDNKGKRPIHLFFGGKTTADIYCYDMLHKISDEYANFDYIPTVSKEPKDSQWRGERRRLVTEVVEDYLAKRLVGDKKPTSAYLCGAPGMIDACRKVLEKYGITDIYYDAFT